VKALVGFAGFGGVDIALRDFGFQVTGIEIDSAIAEVNRFNGGHCLTADLLEIDPADYIGWSLFHFSPPCPSFSVAKSGGAETEDDLALARKICQFIRVGRPEYFTLENVWLYRKSLSWLLIWYTLLEQGYSVDAWNLNAADYGVPQSRRRMIVIARRDGRKPAKPFPTHSQKPDMFTVPHRGWYETVENLIPDLPEGEFADWQKDRLPDDWKSCLINNNSCGGGPLVTRGAGEPSFTVVSSIGGKGAMLRAILIPGDNESNGTIRNGDEPMVTVQTRPPERCPHRAFILDSANANSRNGVTIRNADEPIFTITTMAKQADLKAMNKGKVVLMTPRALARFQDFPDWYALPENRNLACYGIGNAVPPGLYRAVLESMRLNYEIK
jgi:DNA (cytosine-5)-methyltransferase 1